MKGNKLDTKGEDRKITIKQYPFCEIKFIFHLSAFLALLFWTTWSCDQRELSVFCFPLTQGSSKCQRTGGKANFLLELDLSSNGKRRFRHGFQLTEAQLREAVAEQK